MKVKRLRLELQAQVTLKMTMATESWRVLSARMTLSVWVRSVAYVTFMTVAVKRSARFQELLPELFEVGTELVDHDAPPDAGPSTEMVSVLKCPSYCTG